VFYQFFLLLKLQLADSMARILEIDLEEYIPAERMREWPDETFE
jgi:hypothetical protein